MGASLAISTVDYSGTFLRNYFEIEQLASEEMSFKDFYFKLWWPFCSVERNHFSTVDKRSPKKHFCVIILKSGHWSRRRCHLKGFSDF